MGFVSGDYTEYHMNAMQCIWTAKLVPGDKKLDPKKRNYQQSLWLLDKTHREVIYASFLLNV